MPQIADLPRQVERDDEPKPNPQSFVFPVPDGSHWEMQIANTVLGFNVAPGPVGATPRTLPARVLIAVIGTRLYGAPLEESTAEARLLTWPQEAAVVYPTSRSMTDQEQAAYKSFRLRKLRRV
jgi:hypothetical protein